MINTLASYAVGLGFVLLGLVPLAAQQTGSQVDRPAPGPAVPIAAATDTEPPLPAEVAGLVERLQTGTSAERDAAEQQLTQLGGEALSYLPQISADTPEELRARLNRVRKQLQRALAEATVKGSRVTLQGKMPLSEALRALELQSGNKLIDFRDQFGQPPLDPQLTVDFDNAAYWHVLESILDQAGLQLYAYTNQPNTLGYVARADGLTPAAQAAFTELFRLEVIRVQTIVDFRDEQNQGLVTTVEVTWEPRLTPIAIQQSVADLKVVGDGDVRLNPIEGRGITQVAVQEGISSAELEIPFLLPPAGVSRIARFEGTLMATIPGGNMTLEFDELAKAREVTKGQSGISVMLLRVSKNRDLYDLRVILRIEDVSAELQTQRGWVYSNEAYLVDPHGQRVDYAGLESFRETYEDIGLSYKFDVPEGLDGYRFFYKSPSTVMTVPVKYQLKDIRLR